MSLRFRPYAASDRAACLSVFRSNVPHFFAPEEAREFAEFLEREVTSTDYFVALEGGTLLACGGVHVEAGLGSMVWGMVTRSAHRQGLGRLLLLKRLEHLYRNYPDLRGVRLDTSQHSQGFFARFGFTVDSVIADGYASGLDRYEMTLTKEALARLLTAAP